MRRSHLFPIFTALGAAFVIGTMVTRDAAAQQSTNSMFNADIYWSGYWDWYDTEYVPAYRSRAFSVVTGDLPFRSPQLRQGSSPAISGAPDAGGDYDDYPAAFYVPGGASEFYIGEALPPVGDVVPPAEEPPLTDPDVVITDPDIVNTDPDAPRTIRPRARTDDDRSRIPPDIDAEIPPPEGPVAGSKPEVWY